MSAQISDAINYLADFSKILQKVSGSFSSAGLRYDWLVIFFFVFAVFIIALSFGRSRMLLALLSLYAASFLESHFIYFDKLKVLLKDKPDYWVHVGIFSIFYIIVYGILIRSFLKNRLTLAEMSLFPLIIIAISEIGFLAATLMSFFPRQALPRTWYEFLPYFGTKNAQFWWALIPFLLLVIFKRKKDYVRN